MPHLDASTVVLENMRGFATCAPGPLSGPAMGETLWQRAGCAIGVREGRIRYIGAREGLGPEFSTATRFDCQKRLLLPALIDCHTHPAFVAARSEEWNLKLRGVSYEEIAAKGGGILSSARAVRNASNDELAQAAIRNLGVLKAHGIAVAECKSGYGLSLEHELRQLRAIAHAGEQCEIKTISTCLAAHSLPEERRGMTELREQYLREVCEQILPQAASSGLASRADAFCERGAFSADETRQVGLAAKACGMDFTVHAEQLSHSGGAMVAAELKAKSADHLEYIEDADIAAMKASGTAAVLLPGSTFFLRQEKWAPARKLIDSGLCVALSTDFNPGSSPICNPAFIMHLAVKYLAMSPAECLAAFTVNAAYALGLNAAEWGAIAKGARAAFSIWDVDGPMELPYYVGSNLCAGVVTCRGWRD